MSSLLAAVGSWLCLFVIPLYGLVVRKKLTRELIAIPQRLVVVGVIFVAAAAIIGGAMSGVTGAFGSSLGALLWFAWFALTYAAWK